MSTEAQNANNKVIDFAVLPDGEIYTMDIGDAEWPMTGGIATPFGIRLTGACGWAGVTSWQLFITGMMLGAASIASRTGIQWLVRTFAHVPVPMVESILGLLAYLTIFRLTPLGAIHSSEHQVIHVLEKGIHLTPDNIKAQNRVHPRCGTNIMAWLVILSLVMDLYRITPWPPILGIAAGLILARQTHMPLGTFFQRYFTTKKVRAIDIERAQKVALQYNWKVLTTLRSYNANALPGVLKSMWLSFNTSGFVELMAGVLVTAIIIATIQIYCF